MSHIYKIYSLINLQATTIPLFFPQEKNKFGLEITPRRDWSSGCCRIAQTVISCAKELADSMEKPAFQTHQGFDQLPTFANVLLLLRILSICSESLELFLVRRHFQHSQVFHPLYFSKIIQNIGIVSFDFRKIPLCSEWNAILSISELACQPDTDLLVLKIQKSLWWTAVAPMFYIFITLHQKIRAMQAMSSGSIKAAKWLFC